MYFDAITVYLSHVVSGITTNMAIGLIVNEAS